MIEITAKTCVATSCKCPIAGAYKVLGRGRQVPDEAHPVLPGAVVPGSHRNAAGLAGFLVGFVSQSQPGDAYIHFVGVHPPERGHGLGRRLYGTLFDAVRGRGCTRVRAITSPVNTGSIAFHRRMGFRLEPGDAQVDGIPVATGYDGPGQDRVRFVMDLPS